ncbi:MAG: hypothetical protein JWM34_2002 [Ilumatobacteraceae bacterium]|nr:hypothetical protein [Ilumatobacteraceae bacterium]
MQRRPLRRAALALFLLASGTVTATSGAVSPAHADATGPIQPKVVGNQLVDARTGKTWVPHGANWPDMEYACVEGYVPDHPAVETQTMATWGIDVVRIPLNEDCWLGTDGAPTAGAGTASQYKARVQARVNAIHAAGMVAILDLHWTAPAGKQAFGQRPMADAQSVTFWQQVATAYKSDASTMFELFNEPYSRPDANNLTWDCWKSGGCLVPNVNDDTDLDGSTYPAVGMATLVSTVRATGATQPLLLGGLNYSNDLTGWLAHAPADSQLVAAWHNYPAQGCWNTPGNDCWDTTILSVAAHVPVLMTEFGYEAGDTGQFDATMAWADQHGIGYLPWAWWVNDPSDDAASKLYALVDGADYHPKAPGGVKYHDHLATLVANPPNTGGGTGGGGTSGGSASDYVSVVPDRALDTRPDTQVGYTGPKPTAGQTIQLDVTGVGASKVPDNATAVVLNVTGTDVDSAGYVTVWPCGSPQPTASNLNLVPGTTSPNLVISKIGDGGKVCIFTQPSAHLIADINGYMPAGSTYTPLVPERLLETRANGQTGYTGGKPAAGTTIALQVTGAGTSTVPANATAAVLNITGTGADGAGYVTVWPCGTPQPTTSNLNIPAGGTAPNLVMAEIGEGGKVCIYNQTSMDLIADINGYVPAASYYTPVQPERLLETRADGQTGYAGGKPAAGTTIELTVTGVGASKIPATATAVALNVTGVDADAAGYVTVWPCGSPQPTASNLNLEPGGISPNLVMSKIGTGGKVCIYTQASAHLLADVNGYWP